MQGYRTYIAAALIAAFGFLATVDWLSVMQNPKDGLWLVGSGLIMAIMRKITTTPPAL